MGGSLDTPDANRVLLKPMCNLAIKTLHLPMLLSSVCVYANTNDLTTVGTIYKGPQLLYCSPLQGSTTLEAK